MSDTAPIFKQKQRCTFHVCLGILIAFCFVSGIDAYSSLVELSSQRWGVTAPTFAPTRSPSGVPTGGEKKASKRSKRQKKVASDEAMKSEHDSIDGRRKKSTAGRKRGDINKGSNKNKKTGGDKARDLFLEKKNRERKSRNSSSINATTTAAGMGASTSVQSSSRKHGIRNEYSKKQKKTKTGSRRSELDSVNEGRQTRMGGVDAKDTRKRSRASRKRTHESSPTELEAALHNSLASPSVTAQRDSRVPFVGSKKAKKNRSKRRNPIDAKQPENRPLRESNTTKRSTKVQKSRSTTGHVESAPAEEFNADESFRVQSKDVSITEKKEKVTGQGEDKIFADITNPLTAGQKDRPGVEMQLVNSEKVKKKRRTKTSKAKPGLSLPTEAETADTRDEPSLGAEGKVQPLSDDKVTLAEESVHSQNDCQDKVPDEITGHPKPSARIDQPGVYVLPVDSEEVGKKRRKKTRKAQRGVHSPTEERTAGSTGSARLNVEAEARGTAVTHVETLQEHYLHLGKTGDQVAGDSKTSARKDLSDVNSQVVDSARLGRKRRKRTSQVKPADSLSPKLWSADSSVGPGSPVGTEGEPVAGDKGVLAGDKTQEDTKLEDETGETNTYPGTLPVVGEIDMSFEVVNTGISDSSDRSCGAAQEPLNGRVGESSSERGESNPVTEEWKVAFQSNKIEDKSRPITRTSRPIEEDLRKRNAMQERAFLQSGEGENGQSSAHLGDSGITSRLVITSPSELGRHHELEQTDDMHRDRDGSRKGDYIEKRHESNRDGFSINAEQVVPSLDALPVATRDDDGTSPHAGTTIGKDAASGDIESSEPSLIDDQVTADYTPRLLESGTGADNDQDVDHREDSPSVGLAFDCEGTEAFGRQGRTRDDISRSLDVSETEDDRLNHQPGWLENENKDYVTDSTHKSSFASATHPSRVDIGTNESTKIEAKSSGEDAENDPYLETDVVEFIGNLLQEDVRSWLNATTEDGESGDTTKTWSATLGNETAAIEGSRGGFQEPANTNTGPASIVGTVHPDHVESSTGGLKDHPAEKEENAVDVDCGESGDDSQNSKDAAEECGFSNDKSDDEGGQDVQSGDDTSEEEAAAKTGHIGNCPSHNIVPNRNIVSSGNEEDANTGAGRKTILVADDKRSALSATGYGHTSVRSGQPHGASTKDASSQELRTCVKETAPLNRMSMESSEDKESDAIISVVTWNLAEDSPTEEDASFMRRFRKCGVSSGTGSDLVLIAGQECENIKPRRTEGRRSREYRRLMIKMLGREYVPIALHLLGGIQFGLFARKSFLKEVEQVAVSDVTCGIGNVFHNKGAIAAFVTLKARYPSEVITGAPSRAKSLKLMFVSAHLAAHVKNFDARDSDFWRISAELEAQAPEGFLPRRSARTAGDAANGSFLFDSVDRVFFCGDLNYRVDLPRESAEQNISYEENASDPTASSALLRHDQLVKSMSLRRAFPGFAEGKIMFAPTFKFDKDTEEYDTSHKQRIPAFTDRVLFKPLGTRVLEYASVPHARHSDHRPVHATFRMSMEGGHTAPKPKRKRSRGASESASRGF